MPYKISLPPKMMRSLWLLKTYCGEPAIIQQIRSAVESRLKEKEQKLGSDLEDICETIQRHEQETKSL